MLCNLIGALLGVSRAITGPPAFEAQYLKRNRLVLLGNSRLWWPRERYSAAKEAKDLSGWTCQVYGGAASS